MYKELLTNYLEDMKIDKLNVFPGHKVQPWGGGLDGMPEEVAEEVYKSLKRLENGEGEEISIGD